MLHDRREQRRRNGKVERRSPRGSERLADGLERGGIIVVTVHVAQQSAQFLKCRPVKSAVLLKAVLCPGLELAGIPARFGHANDRHVEIPSLQHRLERREDFLVSQVARGAEKNKGIGMR